MKTTCLKKIRRGLCAALALLLSAAVPAAADAGAAEGTPRQSGEVRVCADWFGVPRLIAGTYTDKKVTAYPDALEAAKTALEYLGAGSGRELEQYADPIGILDLSVYVFAEMKHGQPVESSFVKVLVRSDGTVLGAVSALSDGKEPVYVKEPVTPEQAQEAVRAAYPDISFDMIVSEALPRLLSDDASRDTQGKIRSVYRVYTNDPEEPERNRYLVHFVEVTGRYLFSTKAEDVVQGEVPDQEFDHDTVFRNEALSAASFEYMPTEAWKDFALPASITLNVMRDGDGTYYLIDPERHVAVADYYEFTYAEEKSIDIYTFKSAEELPQEAAILYWNFARIYDHYESMGWMGPDGKGTDTLLLYYYCDKDRKPDDSAFYEGFRKYGYQIFTFGKGFGDAYATDIIAHEFTHCVTGASLVEPRYYYNEQGAINEAMSDIIGCLADAQITGEDGKWLIGRYAVDPLRSFAEPGLYEQPDRKWGRYYTAPVYMPRTDENDNGGVHRNSSIVNRIAYMLCAEGGMPAADAQRLWLYTDMALTGKTDFAMLADTLEWALESTGLTAYSEALHRAIDSVGLRNTEVPESAVDGTVIVTAPVVIGENENADMFHFACDRDLTVAVMLPKGDFSGYDMVEASMSIYGDYRLVLPTDADGNATAILIVYRPNEEKLAVLHPGDSMWKIVSADLVLPDRNDPGLADKLKEAADTYGLQLRSGQSITVQVVELLRYLAG